MDGQVRVWGRRFLLHEWSGFGLAGFGLQVGVRGERCGMSETGCSLHMWGDGSGHNYGGDDEEGRPTMVIKKMSTQSSTVSSGVTLSVQGFRF